MQAQPAAKTKKESPGEQHSTREEGSNKRKRRPLMNKEMAVAAPQEDRPPLNEHFEQLLNKPCTNHGYPVKHKFKDCDLMKRLLRRSGRPAGGGRDKQPPTD